MVKEQRLQAARSDAPKFLADVKGFGYPASPSVATNTPHQLPPSFFVIGAPRCGSTAISDTLKANPHISFSVPKESHYLQQGRSKQSIDEWRHTYVERYHPRLHTDHQAMGDGSVSYLFFPDSIQRALEFDSRSKFIAVFRHPVEMVQSFHLRLLYLLDETVEDFASAWAMQESRARGENIPPLCRDPRMLQYSEMAQFSTHLQRVFDVVGRDRCMVLLFEDLLNSPRETYLDLLEFIGVDDDGQTEFSRKRESAAFKSQWLQRLLMNPPEWVLRRVQAMNIRNVPHLKRLRKKLKKLNNQPISPPPLAAETESMLREHFAPEIARLALLLERDLSHWR